MCDFISLLTLTFYIFIFHSFIHPWIAAQETNCQKARLEVKASGDLNDVSSCKSFSGSIIIMNLEVREIHLSYLRQVDGDVIVSNLTELKWLDFPVLHSIQGTLKLDHNPNLETISVPKLNSIDAMDMNNLPTLKSLSFPAGLSHINHLSVTDTGITTIDGLSSSSISDINLAGNLQLNHISLDQLEQIEYSFYISNNGHQLSLNLSSLKRLGQGTFQSLSNIDLHQLHDIHEDLDFAENMMINLSLPMITELPGALTIANNTKLETLSMPQLMKIDGAFIITGNHHLNVIDSFSHLEQVGGSIEIDGQFADLQLPKLHEVFQYKKKKKKKFMSFCFIIT
ncbi:uncharacterized protein BX664DRAFT_254442 [Halteromyces radiatus]|uniref:uncharacterized protein n=1 Tax=Halteromyces radiatus TaxID=101107 RepID=UPI00221EE070|nr:uncharacterized protein BX664DRAFT_254442 [Halteromyces radiatus]KAI8099872.1 hypothetical protein BX664DRAFT_254442 [Halteromyces radiatus]